eukprot:CAMPEP_0116943758 /NCGR_PEP_ID=MMETSP0467-20121206/35383_1 /TAXON_ID=283647 /ORGANISM="Mesodinium pulex, Strain SPMC105" /LENGTH=72 /DNA_ID=CAMNT_0004627011 /DNA_START=154 /DNA_END=372 /DNA_ORIENTATION=+
MPDPNGNPNDLLRGDGTFKGISIEDLVEFFKNPQGMPGLVEESIIESVNENEFTRFIHVKAPMCAPRHSVFK